MFYDDFWLETILKHTQLLCWFDRYDISREYNLRCHNHHLPVRSHCDFCTIRTVYCSTLIVSNMYFVLLKAYYQQIELKIKSNPIYPQVKRKIQYCELNKRNYEEILAHTRNGSSCCGDSFSQPTSLLFMNELVAHIQH